MTPEWEPALAALERATAALGSAGLPALEQALAEREQALARLPRPLPADERLLTRLAAVHQAGARALEGLAKLRQQTAQEWTCWKEIQNRLSPPAPSALVDYQG